MNILASNDDGYQCEGVIRLVSALRTLGHRVLMVSPDRERSGASHSMSLAAGHIDIKEIAADTWICAGTPVDCITAVLSGGIKFRVDAVVSGINAGCNLGTDIIFSGTAAAAREGALHGIPSVAFSLAGSPKYFWDEAASWSARHLDKLIKNWNDEVFINVNIPNTKNLPDAPLTTFPSRRRYTDNISVKLMETGWSRIGFNNMKPETVEEAGSDHQAVSQNEVSVSFVYIQPMAKT
ncbi:MAG: 5'/3'-nucleotidase SurE [Spirochaetaceae bacterium]|jgi:5'-nucleotidase|nr:5'/3'-nucleotidase SurE [Spirochaetaceae bacterium]